MTIRHAAKAVALTGAVASVGALSALAFSGTAGAAIPSGGQSNSLIPVAPFTAGTPFASGQTVTVTVGPSALTPAQNVSILLCAAPNGVLPTLPSQCDPNTVQGDSVIPAADGSFNYVNSYQVYKLPSPALGEGPSVTPVCGNTAATECVLGIFDNFNDFTAPHVFSQPFKIQVTGPETGTINNPGDGTPEVPLAIGLPLAAAGLMAGGLVLRRRRSNAAA